MYIYICVLMSNHILEILANGVINNCYFIAFVISSGHITRAQT